MDAERIRKAAEWHEIACRSFHAHAKHLADQGDEAGMMEQLEKADVHGYAAHILNLLASGKAVLCDVAVKHIGSYSDEVFYAPLDPWEATDER